MIRVLHIIKGLGRGGAERLLVETIPLHSRGYQFDVVYFLPWKNQLVGELEKMGCRVYLLPATKTPFMFFRIPQLVALLKKENYQLIHCHLPWAGIVARWAALFLSIPVVYTEHNNFFTYNRITQWLHRLGIRRFAHVITVSHDSEQSLKTAIKRLPPVTTILNGVNTDKFRRDLFTRVNEAETAGIPQASLVIGTAAVFRQQKRLDRWLTIAKKILEKDREVFFVVMGDGPLRNELHAQAHMLGFDQRIVFTGLVEDTRPFLACTDVYLMSSDYEGLPVALLEAMSMGCTPVVTGVGGIPSIITSYDNGIIYPKDSIEEAVGSILDLGSNRGKLLAYGNNARQRVISRYSVVRMVTEVESVYGKSIR
jgi:L-malate glycosyltransferase